MLRATTTRFRRCTAALARLAVFATTVTTIGLQSVFAAPIPPTAVVVVKCDNSLVIEAKRYAAVRDLKPKISELHARRPLPYFGFQAERCVSFKTLNQALQMLIQAGFHASKVGFLVEPRK
jgi:biopolymer transport protein ExbD